MTIPIENSSAQPARELVQRRYNTTIELEKRLRNSIQTKTPSDPNIWGLMRENYEAIILEDHDFSELHEIEHALWHLHYKRIEDFRARMRNSSVAATGNIPSQGGKSGLRREQVNKIRSVFKSFLSEATGFYHDLILKIRAKYGLPLDYFSHQGENYLGSYKDESKSADFRKGQVSCHRCLIYLGDLARYKDLYGEMESSGHDFSVAESYYVQAASLWPSSGNPHHQLAILATYTGDELVAVYRYFRSLAIENPFSTARDNLILIFEKNRVRYSQLPLETELGVTKVPIKSTGKGRGRGDVRFAVKDPKQGASNVKRKHVNIDEINKTFRIRFVRLNGILFTRTSLETFEEVYSSVINDFEELLISGPDSEMGFGSDTRVNGSSHSGLVVLQLVAVLIFTVHNVKGETECRSLSYAEILQRSVLLQHAFTAAFELAGHIVKRCLNVEDVSSSPLLPAVLVFIEWLACRPDIVTGNDVEEKQASSRSFYWHHCTLFLNKLWDLEKGCQDFNGASMESEPTFTSLRMYHDDEAGDDVALWEDFELRGFLPLAPSQLALDFSKRHSYNGLGGKKEKRIRMQRILAAGKAVTSSVEWGGKAIYFDEGSMKFVVTGEAPQRDVGDKVEAVRSKGCITVEKFNDLIGEETISNDAKENLSIEKLGSTPPGASTLKTETDKEEEEDEVIVFKPTVTERNLELPVSNLQHHAVSGANVAFQDRVSEFAPSRVLVDEALPQHGQSNISNLHSLHELSSQIIGYTGSFSAGRKPSLGTYSTAQEVPKLFGIPSTIPVDPWSSYTGMASAGSMKDYVGVFANNHEKDTSWVNSQQPLQEVVQMNVARYGGLDGFANGMKNLNLGYSFTDGSMFRSELPSGTTAKVENVTSSNLLPLNLQFTHTTPLVNGVSVSKPVASMPGVSVIGDISLASVKPYASPPKTMVENHVTKAELASQYGSDTVQPTGTTSTAAKTANVAAVGTKRGPVNRPVRHFGPPPGFGPVPNKLPDSSKVESISHGSGASLVSEQTDQRNEQPQIDDYSWLDGYTSPSKDMERKDPLGCHPSYSFLPIGDNLINDVANFPFPGKQVSNTQRIQEQQDFQTRQQLEYKVTPQQQHSLWSGLYFGQNRHVS